MWQSSYWSGFVFFQQKMVVQRTTVKWKIKEFRKYFDCTLGAIKGVEGYVQQGANTWNQNVDHHTAVNEGLKWVNKVLDDAWGYAWGGVSAKSCLQMFWYSDLIELAGTGPAPIGSEHCGTIGPGNAVDPQMQTPWWNVSKVTGETGQKLLVRVRQPNGQNLAFPYKLMLFAGGIF